eukprot:13984806-Alexandrium_andersonii.AAC.1
MVGATAVGHCPPSCSASPAGPGTRHPSRGRGTAHARRRRGAPRVHSSIHVATGRAVARSQPNFPDNRRM